MAVFAYKAMDVDAALIRGTVVADTPRQARDTLRARGLSVCQVDLAQPPARAGAWSLGRSRRVQAHKLLGFVRELATLLGAGIVLLDAIDAIAPAHHGRFRTVLLALRERICAGSSLAEAMNEQPVVFDELCVSVTQVGEHAGTLDQSLATLADYRERASQLKSRLSTALLYPGFVLLIGTAVAVLLMSVVVPELLANLVAAGQTLPWPTVVVKAASDLLVGWWWALLAGVVAVVLSLSVILASRPGRRIWHRLQLRLPVIGPVIVKQEILRLSVVLATLLRSGIEFVAALQIARRSVHNLVLQDALIEFQAAVTSGRELSVALARTGAFPRPVVQLLSVGQQSGRLEEMLERLAADYDRQLSTAAQRLTAVLEPLLIVILALIVGFIAFATILPILEAGHVM